MLFYPDSLAPIVQPEDEEMDESGETFTDIKVERALLTAKQEARVAADYIFKTLAQSCPLFVALSIDINDPAGGDIDCVEFMRAQQTDLHGRKTHVAQSVEENTIKYYEPCSDILKQTQEDDLFGL